MSATDLEKAAASLLAPAQPVEEDVSEEDAETETEATAPDDVQTDAEAADTSDEAEEDHSDEDESESDDAGQEQPTTFTVKVDGKDVEVTLDDLKRSYSGNAYVQKGMQEAAQAKKEAQTILEALQAEQKRFMDFAQRIQSEGFRAPPKAPDPKMAQTDPIGYIEAKAAYDADWADYQSQQQEIQRYSQAQQAMTQEQRRAHLEEQARILAERIPGFADPEKGEAIRDGLRKTGEAYGFSADELGAIEDARAVQVLHDAMQWRQLQAAKSAPKKPTPRNVKPAGKRPEPQQLARARAIEQARKSGRLDAWASVLLEPKSS